MTPPYKLDAKLTASFKVLTKHVIETFKIKLQSVVEPILMEKWQNDDDDDDALTSLS